MNDTNPSSNDDLTDEDRLTQWCHENPKQAAHRIQSLQSGTRCQVDGFPCNSTDRCESCPVETSGSLKASLWKYGKHLTACRLQTDPNSWCDCGWAQIRETLAPAQGLPEEPSPDQLVGALQDRVHNEIGVTRPAHAVKISTRPALCNCLDGPSGGHLHLETPAEKATAPRTKFTGDERYLCKHCNKTLAYHNPWYECPPLNGE